MALVTVGGATLEETRLAAIPSSTSLSSPSLLSTADRFRKALASLRRATPSTLRLLALSDILFSLVLTSISSTKDIHTLKTSHAPNTGFFQPYPAV
jgi:hypothetical protein